MSERAPTERTAVVALSLVALVLATHAHLAGFEPVYDDRWTVVQNAFAAHPENLELLVTGEAFSQGVIDAERPLMVASVILDRALFGLRPLGHHVHSIAWHLLATLLVGLLVWLALGDRLRAWLSATVFAVLPAHAEAVAVVSYREDLIATALLLVALIVLLHRRWALLAAPLVALAFFAKESAAAILVLWPALHWLRRAEPKLAVPDSRPVPVGLWRGLLLAGLGLCIALGVRCVWAGNPLAPAAPVSVPDRGGVLSSYGAALRTLFLQLGQLAVPINLGPAHPDPPPDWPGPLELLAGLALLSLLAVAVRRRAHPMVTGGVLLALAGMLPLVAPFRIPNLWADRSLYLPAVGASIAAAAVIARTCLQSRRRIALLLVAAALLLVVHGAAEQRYHDERTLWTNAVRLAPTSPRAWLGLAAVELSDGNRDEAGRLADKGLALEERRDLLTLKAMLACLRYDRGSAWALFAQGEALPAAEGPARQARREEQRAACALYMRQFDEALRWARAAEQSFRWTAEAYAIEGLALQGLGRLDEADAALAKAIAADPQRPELQAHLARLRREQALLPVLDWTPTDGLGAETKLAP